MKSIKLFLIALLAITISGTISAQDQRPAQGERKPPNAAKRLQQPQVEAAPPAVTGNPNGPKGAPVEHFLNINTDGVYVKVALNAYSFVKPLNDYIKGRNDANPMTLFDLIDFCAHYRIDALDATGYFFVGYPDIPTDEYIYKVKQYAFRKGVDISGTGIINNFANPDADARKQDVQRVKDWIDVASKLGAPVIRVFSGPVPAGYENKWDEVCTWLVECFKEVADYGQSKGVIVGVQNHGDMMATGEQTVKVMKAVNHPWFGLILDTGYFQSDDVYDDMEMCLPYVVNWQIKESVTGRENLSPIDLDKIMKFVRKANYRGYLPVETLSITGRPYEPLTLVPEFIDQVRTAIVKEFEK